MRFFLYLDYLDNLLIMVFNCVVRIYYWFRPDVRRLTKRNKLLSRKHDRCFIICNGPSLKETDISKIIGSDTITVNFFYKNELYKDFESDYHVAIDGKFYEDENVNYLMNILRKHSKTKLVVKCAASNIFKKSVFANQVFYVNAKQIQFRNQLRVNLTKCVSAPINVSIMATQLALYLGYKEIYLLGVDFNEFALKNFEHFYKEDKPNTTNTLPRDIQFRAFSIAIKHHYELNKYAKRKGIKIYNATPRSYLDAYPFVNYNDIVQGE